MTTWNENGQKEHEGNFKDDEEDGLFTNWYESGQKKLEGNFKDGVEISAIEFNEDGSVYNIKGFNFKNKQ